MTTTTFPTRRGKLVDTRETRTVEGGIMGWAAQYDRRARQYFAEPIFIPTGDVA